MFGLLRKLDGRPSPVIPAAAIYGAGAQPSPAIEAEFFAGVRLPNGTFKTTADHRLDDLNQEIERHLPPGPLRIKDVAVSSGISTLEWCEALDQAGRQYEMTATDIMVAVRLASLPGGLRLLIHNEQLLQIDVAGFAFRPDQIGRRERVLYALPIALARRLWLRRILTVETTPVTLTSPRFAANRKVRVVEENLSEPAPGEWDVIRAANILNPGYFRDQELRGMLDHLVSALTPGGLLALGRTDPAAGNRASVFKREEGRMHEVGRLHGGSEVASLVL